MKPPATVSISNRLTIQDTADIQKENTDLQDITDSFRGNVKKHKHTVCSFALLGTTPEKPQTLILSLIYVSLLKLKVSFLHYSNFNTISFLAKRKGTDLTCFMGGFELYVHYVSDGKFECMYIVYQMVNG